MIEGLQVFSPGGGWLAPLQEKVVLAPGDVLRVSVAVPYRGPEAEFTLYSAIGRRGLLAFNEILVGRAALACPDSPDSYVTVLGDVDIQIVGSDWLGLGGISPGTGYDLYVKIEERPNVFAEIDNVIDIAGAAGAPDLTGMAAMVMPLLMLGMVMPLVGGEETGAGLFG